ncbi:MAG: alpha/beta hydrolase [Proteobacteria bacterium]|nr:alpha/beta hydrolase [Pseudomonadota bacterium]
MTNLPKRFIETSYGRVAYLEAGDPGRPTVLLIHGIPTSGLLWRHVVRMLASEFHCIAPDLLGLGDSTVQDWVPVHMEAQAEMLIELLDRLGHDTCSLVAHDQGGAAAQLLAAVHPDRVRTLTLTNCVAFDNWPVPEVTRLQALWRVPVLPDLLVRAGLFALRETATPFSAFRRGLTRGERLSGAMIREYLRPLHGTALQRRGFVRFLNAGSPRPTLAAVEGLRRFHKPTLVLWAGDDRYISPSWGKRLAEEIPGAVGFHLVPFCGHFWQEERPAEFAAHLLEFLRRHDDVLQVLPSQQAG